ncbi:MAG: hypothetical protein WC655_06235, partial [Candidatus Hydrogenedentales bacterium]
MIARQVQNHVQGIVFSARNSGASLHFGTRGILAVMILAVMALTAYAEPDPNPPSIFSNQG